MVNIYSEGTEYEQLCPRVKGCEWYHCTGIATSYYYACTVRGQAHNAACVVMPSDKSATSWLVCYLDFIATSCKFSCHCKVIRAGSEGIQKVENVLLKNGGSFSNKVDLNVFQSCQVGQAIKFGSLPSQHRSCLPEPGAASGGWA